MSTRTRQELAVAVLRDMGELDADEQPSAEDAAYVKGLYDDKLEEWRDEELVYWTADAIPKVVFNQVKDLIVNEARGAFGEPSPPEEKQARETILLKRLRRHVARHSTGLPTQTEYF